MGVHSKVLSPAFRAGAPVIGMAPSPSGYVSAYRPYSSLSTVSPSSISPYGAHTPEVVSEGIAGSTVQLSIAGKTNEQLWNDSVRSRLFGNP